MPPQTDSSSIPREAGTASVELIAVVPFLLLAVLVAAQLAIAGQTLWSAGVAARAGARAAAVGGKAEAAARRALPQSLRDGSEVTESNGVAVRVRVPRLIPGFPSLDVSAETQLADDDG